MDKLQKMYCNPKAMKYYDWDNAPEHIKKLCFSAQPIYMDICRYADQLEHSTDKIAQETFRKSLGNNIPQDDTMSGEDWMYAQLAQYPLFVIRMLYILPLDYFRNLLTKFQIFPGMFCPCLINLHFVAVLFDKFELKKKHPNPRLPAFVNSIMLSKK